ncbi:MAG: hypothetical protein ABIF17_02375 [Patescibacteria group bacterium]
MNQNRIKNIDIEKIKVCQNKKCVAIFYFQKNDSTVNQYIKSFTEHYHRLKSFFNVQPPKVNIHFIYNRKEMDKHWGSKSPRWLCGMVDNKSIYTVYIYSPLVFEKLTTHKKNEIIPTIVHETAHTFVSKINQKCFAWLNEGLCQYLETAKLKDKKIKRSDWWWFKNNQIVTNPKIKWSVVAEHSGYAISYNLAKFILEKYNKNILLQLIKIKRTGHPEKLHQSMNHILKQDISDFINYFEEKYKLN